MFNVRDGMRGSPNGTEFERRERATVPPCFKMFRCKAKAGERCYIVMIEGLALAVPAFASHIC